MINTKGDEFTIVFTIACKDIKLISFKKMKLIEFFNKYGTNTTNNFQLLYWENNYSLKNFMF